jgi:hypothetical protein
MRPPIVTGVCPVLETPFTAEGEIDEASFAALVEFQVGAGVHGVMLPGFAESRHLRTGTDAAIRARRGSTCAQHVVAQPASAALGRCWRLACDARERERL